MRYQHVRALPALIEAAFEAARQHGLQVRAVAASAWPRRVEGSPCLSSTCRWERAGRWPRPSVPVLACVPSGGHVAAALLSLEGLRMGPTLRFTSPAAQPNC